MCIISPLLLLAPEVAQHASARNCNSTEWQFLSLPPSNPFHLPLSPPCASTTYTVYTRTHTHTHTRVRAREHIQRQAYNFSSRFLCHSSLLLSVLVRTCTINVRGTRESIWRNFLKFYWKSCLLANFRYVRWSSKQIWERPHHRPQIFDHPRFAGNIVFHVFSISRLFFFFFFFF